MNATMSTTAAGGTAKVWDLADATTGRAPRRRGVDVGGPIAATFGAVALLGAVLPGLDAQARWCVVGTAGLVALLVGGAALRRRQALLSLLLAAAGLASPVAAGAVAMDRAVTAPPAVRTTVLPDSAFRAPADDLVRTSAFRQHLAGARGPAEDFATGLVLRLRSLHGPTGPYPAALQLSHGAVVESAGAMQGVALGAVPAGARLEYRVARSGEAFEVIVVSTAEPESSVAATSALVLAGSE